jgi:hypothetical protein
VIGRLVGDEPLPEAPLPEGPLPEGPLLDGPATDSPPSDRATHAWLLRYAGRLGAREAGLGRRVTTPGGAQLLVLDDLVVKVHHPRTDPRTLRTRVQLSAGRACAAYLLAPWTTQVQRVPDGRLVSCWPRVDVLAPDADDEGPGDRQIWEVAARLLAGLHRLDPSALGADPAHIPDQGGPARLGRALARLRRLETGDATRTEAIRVVTASAQRVLDDLAGAAARADGLAGRADGPAHRALVHGDWHLGQLGRLAQPAAADPYAGWRLLDVDDLGVGDPAWDLGRPAGFWAAGLLDDALWSVFLETYRCAGGPALPQGDPWPALDLPARAAVVVAAVRELTRCAPHSDDAPREELHSDDTAAALVRACARMSQ